MVALFPVVDVGPYSPYGHSSGNRLYRPMFEVGPACKGDVRVEQAVAAERVAVEFHCCLGSVPVVAVSQCRLLRRHSTACSRLSSCDGRFESAIPLSLGCY